MNQLVPADQTSTREIGIAVGAGGSSIAPQNLGEVVRFAEVMCRADIALPKHLRGNAGACMAVALQALEWQMSPFAVASKSYAVNGAIAYEAQLIAAVVNTRSGIKGRLRYEFIGEGNDLSCRVTGILDGQECEYETPPIGAITTKNSPLWKSDPKQQLGYFAARSWARRHCPEVILGVYDRDEAEHFGPTNAKDVTPSVMTRLQERQESAQQREGFDQSFVSRETAALTGEPASDQTEDNSQSSDGGSPSATDDSGGETPSLPAATDTADVADQAGAEDIGEKRAPAELPAGIRMVMEECIDNMLRDAFSEPKDQQANKVEKLRAVFLEPQNLGDHPDFVNRCADTVLKIIGRPGERERAKEYLAGRIPS